MLSIAIIGLGYIGKVHLKALLNTKQKYKILGYYDIKNYSTDIFAYKHLSDLFADNPDVVLISTPSFNHVNLAKKCINNGIKNIVIEKPISFKIREINELEEVSKKKKVNIFPINQLRLKKSILKFREIIKKKKLGKLFNLNFNSFLNRNKEYFKNSTWKGKKKYDGGFLFNQFYHHIDLICWLIGVPDSFKCKMFSVNNQMKDTGSIQFFYKKLKILVNFNFTICVFKKNYEQTITAFFNKGTILLDNNFNNIKEINPKDLIEKKTKKIFKKEDDFILFYNQLYRFLKKKRQTYPSNLTEAKQNIKLITDLYKIS